MVRCDLTYQQGIERHWFRDTRFDYYEPQHDGLGDQYTFNGEVFAQGTSTDLEPFNYQERGAENRYGRSLITGKMRSDATGSLDVWHGSQDFTTLPDYDQDFIEENMPIDRLIEVTTEPAFRLDCMTFVRGARVMPVRNIPGLARL